MANGTGVGVAVAVGLGVGEGVCVAVGVAVGVSVGVGVKVAVGGNNQLKAALSPEQPLTKQARHSMNNREKYVSRLTRYHL